MSNQAADTQAHNEHIPKVVGIYGGKATVKDHLSESLPQEFTFHDGSDELCKHDEGGMQAFQNSDEPTKLQLRAQAIQNIQQSSALSGKTAVVAGHFSFPSKHASTFDDIWTPADAVSYNLIISLEVSVNELMNRIAMDQSRSDRRVCPPEQLLVWQEHEIRTLREKCYSNKILFVTVKNNDSTSAEATITKILKAFHTLDELKNTEKISLQLVGSFGPALKKKDAKVSDAVPVFDGDKTLTSLDTGELLLPKINTFGGSSPLKQVFSSDLGYSFAAWSQAALLYDTLGDNEAFEKRCEEVAAQVTIRPEFLEMLGSIRGNTKVRTIVVTCDLQRIWTKVLQKAKLSDLVEVVGSARFSEGFVVTPNIKKQIVESPQKDYRLYVWAFGDSETDLPMLQAADNPILVIDGQTRSQNTKDKIKEALSTGLRPRQVIMSGGATWLNDARASEVDIGQLELRKALEDSFQLIHATDTPACKLLATTMRDASISSAALRKAHRNAGEHLARELIAKKIGLQQYSIAHVHEGKTTDGFHLFHENKPTIVALMRGGEPMALGMSEVFPQSMFVHAAKAENLLDQHLRGESTVILVDSVINAGDTAVEFVKRIRELRPTIQIVVVTGVAQEDAVKEQGKMEMELTGCGEVTVVALSVSENSYTGRGGTDTGARLFNTTYLEKEQKGGQE
ncbi:hypothetical protein DOTSEDRAFT_71646 [Dothistroma septosporum NZE10]|uniref:Phosphoribosyltransferase domain-containing protein n=1 Tax=Dothistroma septosporum (strain NZE10 / CBS 128990) TaxID=675120 RepID=N1PNB3_DOTSN|nr:hypothetical protein DOTSEDRAFT_71646 [Dothistroma septosporum NZE10]